MTGIAGTSMLPLELAVVAIGLSMILGVADVARLPNWAWRKAEEPKIAYLALVALLPVVGLGMYLVRARPKVKAVAVAGRAASLPFERFGDGAPPMDEEQVAEAPEPIQLVAMKPVLSPALSSPALTSVPSSPAPTTEPAAPASPAPAADVEPAAASRELESVVLGSDTFFSSRKHAPAPAPAPTPSPVEPELPSVAAVAPQREPAMAGAVAAPATITVMEVEPEVTSPKPSPATEAASAPATVTEKKTLRLPASLASKHYTPRQRSSLSEERLTQPVPAGWKADPTGRHQFRYWNGRQWTENVADAGVQDRDSVFV